jgi:23S rRNA (cytidine1920-2'-O)/16S rRNA (cytidine1409-2'-O)-methyltransferase
MKQRLDQRLVDLGLVTSRSQAETYIKLGDVTVFGHIVTKPDFPVALSARVAITATEQYVSRAALKLGSVAEALRLDFGGTTVLDVGSSTGGFTDYALRHGAAKVIAVEVGTNQLHPSLRADPRIMLYEKTDIRNVWLATDASRQGRRPTEKTPVMLDRAPDLIVADVSFISLREILPHLAMLCGPKTGVVAMVKPQFEVGESSLMHKGVIKNDTIRRMILRDFEGWVSGRYKIVDKADSKVEGAKGNRERFYVLHCVATPLQSKLT